MISQQFNHTKAVAQNALILEARDFIEPSSVEAQNQFHRYVEEFKDPTIHEINIFDLNGRIIVSSIESKVGQSVDSASLKVLSDNEFYLISSEAGRNIILSYIPLVFNGSVLGAVEIKSELVHLLDPIQYEMNQITLRLIFIGLVILFLYYVIEWQFVIKPINYLKKQAQNLEQGNLNEPISIKTSDEFGFLANFFDQMRAKLKLSWSRITEFNEELELKVGEKTIELRNEQAKLTSSIQSLRFGFIIVNAGKNIMMSNVAASEIMGVSNDKIDFDFLVDYFGQSFDVTDSYNRSIGYKQSVISPEIDSHGKFLKVSMLPIISEEQVIGSVMVIEDVTEAVLLQRNKEEFFAVASHELRTPLTSIRGNMSLIQDYYKDQISSKEVMNMIVQAYQSSIRLISIVNDFLDASKLEQGKGLGQFEKVNLVNVIDEIIKDLNTTAKVKGLELIFSSDKQLPAVFGDESRLKEVVYNLVGNAINYTQEGRVEVEVGVDGDYLKVVVKDTGVGITAQNQGLLFKKFQQAGKSIFSRENNSSTGMGLYISKLLVNAMHGEIGLLDSSDKGSTFFFTIPIAK